MKCNVYGALLLIALALLVSVPMTQAQGRTRANVPFDYTLDQKTMPAGAYEIGSVGSQLLMVRNLDTREDRLVIEPMRVQALEGVGTPHAKLVFRKYGDQYFLAEIWDGQCNVGIAFPQ